MALLVTRRPPGGDASGPPAGDRAPAAARDLSTEEELRWLWLVCRCAQAVWDYDSWDVLSARQLTLARDAGALIALPIAFNVRSGVHVFAGEFTDAASMVAQAEAVSEATGSSMAPYGALILGVFRGEEAQAARLIEAAAEDAEVRGEGVALTFVQWAAACWPTAWAAMRRRWRRRGGWPRTRMRSGSAAGRSLS